MAYRWQPQTCQVCLIIEVLQSTFSLKICLVLISSSAIANHDVIITKGMRPYEKFLLRLTPSFLAALPLACLGFACSNFAKKSFFAFYIVFFLTRTNGGKMETTSRKTQCPVSKILQGYIKELKLTAFLVLTK